MSSVGAGAAAATPTARSAAWQCLLWDFAAAAFVKGGRDLGCLAAWPLVESEIVVFLDTAWAVSSVGPCRSFHSQTCIKNSLDGKICDFGALGRDPKPV